jgi:hypothetical protein
MCAGDESKSKGPAVGTTGPSSHTKVTGWTRAREIGQEVGALMIIAQWWNAHVRAGDEAFGVSNVAV